MLWIVIFWSAYGLSINRSVINTANIAKLNQKFAALEYISISCLPAANDFASNASSLRVVQIVITRTVPNWFQPCGAGAVSGRAKAEPISHTIIKKIMAIAARNNNPVNFTGSKSL
jgi:hypothetical protein